MVFIQAHFRFLYDNRSEVPTIFVFGIHRIVNAQRDRRITALVDRVL